MKNLISPFKIMFMALLTVAFLQTTGKEKALNDGIDPTQPAPVFTIKDVNGNTINLADYQGKKVLLTFYRNVGCPICNFRFHELQEQAEYFKSKDLIVLAVYESTNENLKKYTADENFYATMIPNPDLSLYKLYSVEKSGGKMMKGMFHGAMGKMKKGKKLFKNKIKQDGNGSRISADFLIDEEGKIQTAYYGKFLGDHLPVNEIKKFLN